ncbi:serine/threonine-protein kinase [Pseudomarimonas salicorniae]|uniref:Serine/threonine protein kinase n=1 Tax=Pseudomarimonas salicorniae TaxID=2933270 RepID=A0ABT0GD66_9GAMM|nr:serine/threonine-protein kinase [Lysobacter sp. CAU 1642]MCK7592489.1 serine/threonine protein kinase [Lysobacter sp. CAU 1642]
MKTQLGHYEIVEELGRGGMGVVYKGFEPALNRYVAIKELSPSLAHDANLVERFLREARSMAQLNDPHIIQVYFIGTEEATGQPFFAMEFVEGDSLSGLLKREGKLSVENSLKLMHQTAMGLATAHDKGVIHRDLKPGNLMITPRGHVKIADFGIALATQDFSKKLTSTGEFVGTPGYLSPEVCLGKTVDQRSDIFALGIVLYEMLAGRLPFTDESPLGLMLEVVKAEIPDIRGLNADVDPQTAEILSKMLAKEPADRFQDCHALIAALQAHPLVARGGTVQLSQAKAAPTDATVVGAPTPASQPQRVPTPPPVVPRATGPSQQQPLPAAPPPAPATAASGAQAQAPRQSEPGQPRRSKAPLWLAAAALVLLVGTGFAFRGAIGEFLLRSDEPANAAVPDDRADAAAGPGASASSGAASPSPSAQAVPNEAPPSGPATLSTLASGSAGDAGNAAVERGELTAASGAESLPPSGPQSEPAAAAAEPRSPLAKALLAKRDGEGAQMARVDPPKPAAKPVPPRVAVVALGDRALSDTAKQRIEERLLAEGFDVLDTELVGGLAGRDLPGILQALRREATMLVVVRADPIGQQQLSAYGEYFTLYSANLSVRSYLIGDRRPLSAGFREKVDFSTMNVNEMTGEALAPHLATLMRELAPHRTRSAAG